MEDVRAVAVDEDARLVEMVIGVAADMRPPIDHQHPLAGIRRQTLGHHRAGEARAHDEIVVARPLLRIRPRQRIVDQRLHPVGDVVPRKVCQRDVDIVAPCRRRCAAQRQRVVARGDEGLGPAGNLHPLELAVMTDDIDDRRRHHRQTRGEILGGLGRADEPRRIVDGEGHQRDVPPAGIGGELVVGLRAEIMDVGAARQIRRIDLDDGPDNDQRPMRPRVGDAGEQRKVHPLVDHAVEAEPRPREIGLVARIGGTRARLHEMLPVDA